MAIGMMGAAMLSQRLGLIGPEAVEEHKRILERFHLPVTCEAVDRNSVLKAMELDKKVKGKMIRWVLLEELGKAVVRSGISEQDIEEVLCELGIN